MQHNSNKFDGKGTISTFFIWYGDLVAPLLFQGSVFSVIDGDLDSAPVDEPANGYHYPRDSRITPVSNYLAMDHILRNCTPSLARIIESQTNNAAAALRYLRKHYGSGFPFSPVLQPGSNTFFDSYTSLTPAPAHVPRPHHADTGLTHRCCSCWYVSEDGICHDNPRSTAVEIEHPRAGEMSDCQVEPTGNAIDADDSASDDDGSDHASLQTDPIITLETVLSADLLAGVRIDDDL